MSLLDQQAAELDYSDHPDDPANWPQSRRYVTSTQRGPGGWRGGGGGKWGRCSHIVARRLDYLPDGWMSVCTRVVRGTVSATPPLRICPRCRRMVGDE